MFAVGFTADVVLAQNGVIGSQLHGILRTKRVSKISLNLGLGDCNAPQVLPLSRAAKLPLSLPILLE